MKESIALLVGGFVLGVIVISIGAGAVLEEYRSKAVSLGVAEWIVDQKTGKTTFTWKEKP